jgi:hypothetical protein
MVKDKKKSLNVPILDGSSGNFKISKKDYDNIPKPKGDHRRRPRMGSEEEEETPRTRLWQYLNWLGVNRKGFAILFLISEIFWMVMSYILGFFVYGQTEAGGLGTLGFTMVFFLITLASFIPFFGIYFIIRASYVWKFTLVDFFAITIDSWLIDITISIFTIIGIVGWIWMTGALISWIAENYYL